MNPTEIHIRHCMLFLFNSGKSATDAVKNICLIYGQDSLSTRKCQKWFKRFRSGNISLEDNEGRGRRSVFDKDILKKTVEENQFMTQKELSEKLNSSQMTISRQLKAIGKVQKLGKWIPYALTESNMRQRVEICTSLLTRHNTEPFLDRVVTCDEKWVLYVNSKSRKQWVDKDEIPQPVPKAGLHPKKIMISVWWNYRGLLHFEFLQRNATMDGELYSQQLSRLYQSIQYKQPALINRKGVIILHDNARPHTCNIVKEKLRELNWEVLPHPPYSPDISPSDYHLFRSLQSFLRKKIYYTEKDIKTDLVAFFSTKQVDFYKRGIDKLPTRWLDIIESGGKYIVD